MEPRPRRQPPLAIVDPPTSTRSMLPCCICPRGRTDAPSRSSRASSARSSVEPRFRICYELGGRGKGALRVASLCLDFSSSYPYPYHQRRRRRPITTRARLSTLKPSPRRAAVALFSRPPSSPARPVLESSPYRQSGAPTRGPGPWLRALSASRPTVRRSKNCFCTAQPGPLGWSARPVNSNYRQPIASPHARSAKAGHRPGLGLLRLRGSGLIRPPNLTMAVRGTTSLPRPARLPPKLKTATTSRHPNVMRRTEQMRYVSVVDRRGRTFSL